MRDKIYLRDRVNGLGWSLALWGIFSVVFGLVILVWPAITLKVFLIVSGVYLIISGIALAVGSIVNTKEKWAGGIVLGILSVIAGLFLLANPGISATVLLYLLATWSLLTGTVLLVGGVEIGKEGIWMIVGGIAALVFGMWAFVNPERGAVAVTWLIGVYVLFLGLVSLAASFKVKKLARDIPSWV